MPYTISLLLVGSCEVETSLKAVTGANKRILTITHYNVNEQAWKNELLKQSKVVNPISSFGRPLAPLPTDVL